MGGDLARLTSLETVSQVGPPSRGGPNRAPRRRHDAIPVCKVVRLGSPDLLETVSQVGPPSRGGPGRQPWRRHDAIPVCKVVRLGSPDLLGKQSLQIIVRHAQFRLLSLNAIIRKIRSQHRTIIGKNGLRQWFAHMDRNQETRSLLDPSARAGARYLETRPPVPKRLPVRITMKVLSRHRSCITYL